MHGVHPELAARWALTCEQILRDRAPAGVEIDAIEFHGSKVSSRAAEWSEGVKSALRGIAEREREERLKTSLELAAQLAGEEIDPL